MLAEDFRKKSNLKWRGILILIQIELKAFWRNKNILLSQIIQPIMYFLFLVMGIGSSIGLIHYGNITVRYEVYALVGVMGLLITNQMTQTIYRTTIDKRWGLLPLKFLSGIKPFYYIIGMSTYPMIGFLFQSCLLYILALVAGFSINVLSFIFAVTIAVTALLFWTSLGILMTVFINDYQRRDTIIAMFILPIGFSAPTFYLMESVPFYINVIAYLNPLTYQITAIRSALFGDLQVNFVFVSLSLSFLSIVISSLVLMKTKLVVKER
ncbi:ABC transporter permease [Shouchella clausii]|uniref:ABC transporter permease n=1 Tax=Shouchella clausii TaxID=79880 RepID=UPI000BA781D8|nr:ABC transporter permease [Shouchella clausii]PAF07512.1 ABC transporter permease [Shouchella clausii]